MIDAKKELQYRLAIRMLEHLSEKGLLSAKELAYAKGLAREKYAPQTVRELSDEEKETVRKCMREKYKGHIVANPKIDEFLEGLERDHGIKLKRLSVTSVIAV